MYRSNFFFLTLRNIVKMKIFMFLFLSAYVGVGVLAADNDTADPTAALPAAPTAAPVAPVSSEHKLRQYLFQNYDLDMVPSKNTSHTVSVVFGLKITSLNVNEAENKFTVNVFMTMKWNDYRLKWKKDDHDGVEKMRVSASNVWTPDISLYNSDRISTMYTQTVKAIVEHDGNVTWVPPELLTVHCNLGIEAFPYDVHTCVLAFGSWAHDGYVIDLQLEKELKYGSDDYKQIFAFFTYSRWQPINASAVRYMNHYPCCAEPYPSITYNIKFQRRPGLYHRVFVGPAVILGFLSSMVFLMPHKTGERTTLGIGVFFCLMLMVLWIADIFPGSLAEAPNILIYYTALMIMTLFSIALSGLMSAMRDNRSTPSDILRRLCLEKLGCFLCVSKDNYQSMVEDDHEQYVVSEMEETCSQNTSSVMREETPPTVSTLTHPPRQGARRTNQWIAIVAVLDRLLFAIHFILTTIITLCVLAPISNFP